MSGGILLICIHLSSALRVCYSIRFFLLIPTRKHFAACSGRKWKSNLQIHLVKSMLMLLEFDWITHVLYPIMYWLNETWDILYVNNFNIFYMNMLNCVLCIVIFRSTKNKLNLGNSTEKSMQMYFFILLAYFYDIIDTLFSFNLFNVQLGQYFIYLFFSLFAEHHINDSFDLLEKLLDSWYLSPSMKWFINDFPNAYTQSISLYLILFRFFF